MSSGPDPLATLERAERADLGPGRGVLASVALLALALACYGQTAALSDSYWDDNAILLALLRTGSVGEYLDMGFRELRREPQGLVAYALFGASVWTGAGLWVSHTISCLTLAASALLLHALTRRLGASEALAFFVGAAFLAWRPDTTVTIIAGNPYRLGVLCGVASFLCLARAIGPEATRRGWYAGALALAALGEYLFLEGVVAYEPARLALLVALLERQRGLPRREGLRPALVLWAPFVALTLPLVAYKLLFKPYGVYAGIYAPGSAALDAEVLGRLAYLLDHPLHGLEAHARIVGAPSGLTIAASLAAFAVALVGLWRLAPDAEASAPAPPPPEEPPRGPRRAARAAVAGFLLLLLLGHSRLGAALGLEVFGGTTLRFWAASALVLLLLLLAHADACGRGWPELRACWRERLARDGALLAVGALLLVAPLGMYLAFGRVMGPDVESRHCSVLQAGYAMVTGVAAYRLLRRLGGQSQRGLRLAGVAGGLLLAGGALTLNANAEVHARCSVVERAFWARLLERLPTLPEGSLLFIDAHGPGATLAGVAYPHAFDLDTHYDLELALNLLHARSDAPAELRRFEVVTPGQWLAAGRGARFELQTMFGPRTVDLQRAIFVHYRGGAVSINREVLAADPEVPYRDLLVADAPVLPPASEGAYPLRARFLGAAGQ